MSRKPKVWELPENFDPFDTEKFNEIDKIRDDVFFWPDSGLATASSHYYRLNRYVSIQKHSTIAIENPFEYFSQIIEDCKRLDITLRIPFIIGDNIRKSFPFLEEGWKSFDITYHKGVSTGNIHFFGDIPNLLNTTKELPIDDSFGRNVLLRFWEALEKRRTYIFAIKPWVMTLETENIIHAERIDTELCKFTKNPSTLQFGERIIHLDSGVSLMRFTFPASKTEKLLSLLNRDGLKNYNIIETFYDQKPYIFKKKRGEYEMGKSRYDAEEKKKISKFRHKVFLELVTVMLALCTAPYVVLEILDWIPFIYQQNHVQKINLIYSIFKSIEKICDQRKENKCIKI